MIIKRRKNGKKKSSDKVLKNSIEIVVMIFSEFPNDNMIEFIEYEKTLDILVIKGIEKIIKFVNTNTLVFLQKIWYSYNIKINFIINTIM